MPTAAPNEADQQLQQHGLFRTRSDDLPAVRSRRARLLQALVKGTTNFEDMVEAEDMLSARATAAFDYPFWEGFASFEQLDVPTAY